jgi:hypothetical protein
MQAMNFMPPNSQSNNPSFIPTAGPQQQNMMQAMTPQQARMSFGNQQQMGTPQRGSSFTGQGSPPNMNTPVNVQQVQTPFKMGPTPTGTAQQAAQHSMQPGQMQGQQDMQPNLAGGMHSQQQGQASAPQSTVTPATPNFPPSAGVSSLNQSQQMAAPLSPSSENKEKERVGVLLEINGLLLKEVMRLQAIQAETKAKAEAEKKEQDEGAEKKEGDTKEEDQGSNAAALQAKKVDPTTGKEFVEYVVSHLYL